MSVWAPLRLLLCALFAAAAIWQCHLYRAEHRVEEGLNRLDDVLRSKTAPAERIASVTRTRTLGEEALAIAPGETRAVLVTGTALTLLRQADAARSLLDAKVRSGERPELLLALGRARAAAGDEPGARAAFLRAAWASPLSVQTLPQALRNELLNEVARMDRELRDGQLRAAPALDP